AISRKLMRMNQYVHDGKWRRHTAELHRYRGRVYRITGCTMGIVGLGHVGKQVAPRAQGMKLNVQTYDPYLDPKIAAGRTYHGMHHEHRRFGSRGQASGAAGPGYEAECADLRSLSRSEDRGGYGRKDV